MLKRGFDMTIGQKIKKIRKFRNMTQQQLGEAVGLDGKGAANRIAQYECDYRVPQKDMLIEMAKALDVNPLHFVGSTPGCAEDIMQTFFWLDEDNRGAVNFFSLIRTNKRGNATIPPQATYDDVEEYWPDNPPVGIWFDYGLVNDFMREWMIRKEELRNKKITYDEYFEWKLNWPDTCDDGGRCEPTKGWRNICEKRKDNR